jgi:hypothetical protein
VHCPFVFDIGKGFDCTQFSGEIMLQESFEEMVYGFITQGSKRFCRFPLHREIRVLQQAG